MVYKPGYILNTWMLNEQLSADKISMSIITNATKKVVMPIPQ